MIRFTLFISLFFCALSILSAQEHEYPGGLLMDDAVYDSLPRMSEFNGTKSNLPTRFSLERYCPEVGNQGEIFSCVGWAVGYGALTIQRAIHNGCTSRKVITQNAHSALFIYNQIKEGNCRQGARISDAVQFLMDHGDCLAGEFDFELDDCQVQPEAPLKEHAQRFAIEDFMTLFDQGSSDQEKIFRVKMALSKKKPVVIGMEVRRNFYQLKEAKFWWPNNGNTGNAGGHAMVVVGYDDLKGAFRLFNSWGPQWGDRGMIWVKYKDFARFCKYAYVLYLLEGSDQQMLLRPDASPTLTAATPISTTPAPPNPITQQPTFRPLVKLGGHFRFRQFSGWDAATNQAVFTEAPVYFKQGYYRTQKEHWQTGQRFQLTATTEEADEYLYVFSIDAKRNVHIHFPRKGKYNQKFKGRNESGLLTSEGAEVLIPGPNKVLSIAHPGKDKLIVLYSKRRIKNFRKLCRSASQYHGDFVEYLWRLLDRQVLPRKEIIYAPDGIQFGASTRSERYIVPLVLEIVSKKEG